MATEPVLLIGAGGLARETIAAMKASDLHHTVGILDDNEALHGKSVGGVGVLGGLEFVVAHPDVRLLVCAGNGIARSAIVERLSTLGVVGDRYSTSIHPTASIAAGCSVGAGTILLANVVLTCDVTVGSHIVAMPNVTLTHDVVVEDFATLCAGVSLGGGVRVGWAAYVGMNASVRQQVLVGPRSTVGMGAVVVDNVAKGSTVVGNPSRVIRSDIDPSGAAADEIDARPSAERVGSPA